MAEFNINIADIKATFTYDSVPAPVSPPALTHLSAFENIEQYVWQPSFQYSKDEFSNPCYIDAANITGGATYLIIVHAAFGANTENALSDIQLVHNRVDVLAWAAEEGHDNPDVVNEQPVSQRGSSLDRYIVWTAPFSPGDIEFALKNSKAQHVYVSGLSIVMVDMSGVDVGDSVNTGDFYYSVNNDNTAAGVAQTTGSEVEIRSADFNLDGGGYVVLASASYSPTFASGSEDALMDLDVNGVRPYLQWRREAEDANAFLSYDIATRMTLPSGINTIKIHGSGQNGTGKRYFHRPSIIVLRESLFNFVTGLYAPSPLWVAQGLAYPTWDNIMSLDVSISEDTPMLILGRVMARRNDMGAMMARLTIDGAPFSELSSCNNVTNAQQDRRTLSLLGLADVNALSDVRIELSAGNYGLSAMEYAQPELVAISLNAAGSGLARSISIAESGTGNDRTDEPRGPVYPADNGEGADTAWASTVGNPGVIPAAHPRLWIGSADTDLLASLRTDAGYNDAGVQTNPPGTQAWQDWEYQFADSWGRDINKTHGNVSREAPWLYTLRWLITQDATHLADALTELDLVLNRSMSAIHADKAREWCNDARAVACAYDWLKGYGHIDEPTERKVMQWMMATSYLAYNDNTLANSIFDTKDWSTSNPRQNFYEALMLGMTYAAITLHGNESYLTEGWVWPVQGTIPTGANAWQVPWATSGGAGPTGITTYTDPWMFVVDRLEAMCLPSIKDRSRGGDWLEGNNYGRAALRHLLEQLIHMKNTAGLDYIADNSFRFLREIFYGQVYCIQPGIGRMFCIGDQTGSADRAQTTAYNRHTIQLLAYGARGLIESAYAQYYLQNDQTVMSGVTIMKTWDFFLGMTSLSAANYKTALDPYFIASGTGLVNSRTDWTGNAISVNTICQENEQNHTHKFQGEVQVYIGGQTSASEGWIITDRKVFSGNSNRSAGSHSGGVTIENLAADQAQPHFNAGDDKDLNDPLVQKGNYFAGDNSVYMQSLLDQSFGLDADGSLPSNSGAPADVQVYTSRGGSNFMCNTYQREFIHLRRKNYVVVYDRMDLDMSKSNGVVRQFWLTQNQPTNPYSDRWHMSAGDDAWCYMTVIDPNGSLNVFWEDLAPCWRATLKPNAFGSYRDLFVVLQPRKGVTGAATTSMISGAEYYLVEIFDTAERQVVVFARNRDATYTEVDGVGAPQDIVYTSTKHTSNWHTVCNLTPARRYGVAVVETATLQVTLSPNDSNGLYIANSGGIVEFDPLSLATVPSAFQAFIEEDGSGVDSSFSTGIVVGTGVPVFDGGKGLDIAIASTLGLADGNAIELGSGSETVVTGLGLPVIENGRGVDQITAVASGDGTIPPEEKDIPVPSIAMVPRVVSTAQTWLPSPDDGDHISKVNNTLDSPNDATFIRSAFTSNGPLNNFEFWMGYAQPSHENYVGQRAKMRVRIRDIVDTPTLALMLELYYRPTKVTRTLIGRYTANLLGQRGVQEIESPVFDLLGYGQDLEQLTVRGVWIPAYWFVGTAMEISEIDLLVEHSGIEKVIP